jgi:predicted enzyme related to lactoylglutathione lyase
MEIETYEHGIPSWVDHSSADPEKARAFYGALFGWDIEVGPPEAGGYAIAHLRGKPVAGIGPAMNPGPPAWSTYVNVTNADAIADLVTKNGGQVFAAPFDVMDVGRMGVFADSGGAVISVWQAGTHKGAAIVNEPNTFSWCELVTTDIPGAKKFYGAVFGWDSETHGGEGPEGYTEWKMGGRSMAGLMAPPPGMPEGIPSFWGVYFAVDDVDGVAQRLAELGGTVMMPPTDIEPGRFAAACDPVGAMFNVIKFAGG